MYSGPPASTPKAMQSCSGTQKPNYIAGVPTLYEAILHNPDMDGVDLSCSPGRDFRAAILFHRTEKRTLTDSSKSTTLLSRSVKVMARRSASRQAV